MAEEKPRDSAHQPDELRVLRSRVKELEAEIRCLREDTETSVAQYIEDVAHDFNNLLTGIMGYANMLRLDAKPGSFAFQAASAIEKSAERATQLTSELLSHAGVEIEQTDDISSEPILGTGNVLLVDDEEIICDVGADMLRALGYNVVAASSGEEALVYYKRYGHEIDLVIIDMVMPDMSGAECFRKLKEMDPSVTTVLSTGYAADEKVQEILKEGMCGFVQKPYAMAQLSGVAHAALAAKK